MLKEKLNQKLKEIKTKVKSLKSMCSDNTEIISVFIDACGEIRMGINNSRSMRKHLDDDECRSVMTFVFDKDDEVRNQRIEQNWYNVVEEVLTDSELQKYLTTFMKKRGEYDDGKMSQLYVNNQGKLSSYPQVQNVTTKADFVEYMEKEVY